MSASWHKPAAVFCVALGFRLLLFLFLQPWQPEVERIAVVDSDAVSFQQLALNLQQGKGFGIKLSEWRPQFYRTPGYPAYLAGVYSVAGVRPWVALLGQAVIDASAAVLFFLFLSGMFGAAVGMAGGLLYALEPALAVFSVTLFSDSLFTAVIVLTLFFMYKITSAVTPRWLFLFAVCAGVSCGVAVLIRPQALLLPAAFGIPYLLQQKSSRLRALLTVLLLFTGFALPVGSWYLRNYQLTGRAFLSTAGEHSLLMLTVARAEAKAASVPLLAMQKRLLAESNRALHLAGKDSVLATDDARAPYWRATAMRYIRNNPARYAAEFIKGMVYMGSNLGVNELRRVFKPLSPPRPGNQRQSAVWQRPLVFQQEAEPAAVLLFFPLLAVWLLSIVLFVKGIKPFLATVPPVMLWVLMLAFAVFIAGIGAAGSFRLKLPLLPLYLPVMANGAVFLWRSAAAWRLRNRFGAAGGAQLPE